jgi:hypothetical protein
MLRAAVALEAASLHIRAVHTLAQIPELGPLENADIAFRTVYFRALVRLQVRDGTALALQTASQALELGIETASGASMASWLASHAAKDQNEDAKPLGSRSRPSARLRWRALCSSTCCARIRKALG